jgi:hypothetical protein
MLRNGTLEALGRTKPQANTTMNADSPASYKQKGWDNLITSGNTSDHSFTE